MSRHDNAVHQRLGPFAGQDHRSDNAADQDFLDDVAAAVVWVFTLHISSPLENLLPQRPVPQTWSIAIGEPKRVAMYRLLSDYHSSQDSFTHVCDVSAH